MGQRVFTGIILAALAGQAEGCIGRVTCGSPTCDGTFLVNRDPPWSLLALVFPPNVTTNWASVRSLQTTTETFLLTLKTRKVTQRSMTVVGKGHKLECENIHLNGSGVAPYSCCYKQANAVARRLARKATRKDKLFYFKCDRRAG